LKTIHPLNQRIKGYEQIFNTGYTQIVENL